MWFDFRTYFYSLLYFSERTHCVDVLLCVRCAVVCGVRCGVVSFSTHKAHTHSSSTRSTAHTAAAESSSSSSRREEQHTQNVPSKIIPTLTRDVFHQASLLSLKYKIDLLVSSNILQSTQQFLRIESSSYIKFQSPISDI